MSKTNKKRGVAWIIAQGFEKLEKRIVEAYRGVADILGAHRTEIHNRFDRLEGIVLADRRQRVRRKKK